MKSEPFIASKAFDLGNLGVIAPHKAKYYNRYSIDWLIGTANAGTQLKYVTFWHEGDEYPKSLDCLCIFICIKADRKRVSEVLTGFGRP